MKPVWLLADNCLKLSSGYMRVHYSILATSTCLEFSVIKYIYIFLSCVFLGEEMALRTSG